jgi:hypothetical protein
LGPGLGALESPGAHLRTAPGVPSAATPLAGACGGSEDSGGRGSSSRHPRRSSAGRPPSQDTLSFLVRLCGRVWQRKAFHQWQRSVVALRPATPQPHPLALLPSLWWGTSLHRALTRHHLRQGFSRWRRSPGMSRGGRVVNAEPSAAIGSAAPTSTGHGECMCSRGCVCGAPRPRAQRPQPAPAPAPVLQHMVSDPCHPYGSWVASPTCSGRRPGLQGRHHDDSAVDNRHATPSPQGSRVPARVGATDSVVAARPRHPPKPTARPSTPKASGRVLPLWRL